MDFQSFLTNSDLDYCKHSSLVVTSCVNVVSRGSATSLRGSKNREAIGESLLLSLLSWDARAVEMKVHLGKERTVGQDIG